MAERNVAAASMIMQHWHDAQRCAGAQVSVA